MCVHMWITRCSSPSQTYACAHVDNYKIAQRVKALHLWGDICGVCMFALQSCRIPHGALDLPQKIQHCQCHMPDLSLCLFCMDMQFAIAGDYVWRISDEGSGAATSAASVRANDGRLYVLMTPLLMTSWVRNMGHEYLTALHGPIAWRQREVMDCSVLMLRACWARAYIGKEDMRLLQLVLGRMPAASTHTSLQDRAVKLPDLGMAQQPHMGRVQQQLGLEEFNQLLGDWRAGRTGNFAFVGPGNKGADGWLFFHELDPDSDKPLVIFLSSKQRTGRPAPKVRSSQIVQEMHKDLFGCPDECQRLFNFVYVYVTDQRVEMDGPLDGRVVVIPKEAHKAFYGSMAQLLELCKVS